MSTDTKLNTGIQKKVIEHYPEQNTPYIYTHTFECG